VDRGDSVLNKKEKMQFERLERLLDAERERAETAWEGYRGALYELVDLRLKLARIENALHGNED
jgi:hypothetical protein